jgi:pimeloyl-ACP methyl ester carboxylesterase
MFDGKSIAFFVRGIAGNPDDFLEWEQKAADHTIITCGVPARAITYHTDFWSVWMRRRFRAQRFARVLWKYSVRDYRITIVAHSEGTVVALDAMRFAGWPRVEHVHLICGACDSDFERTGLNHALRSGKIGKVTTYTAGRDWAMRFENLILGRLFFGLSRRTWSLGLVGPRNVSWLVAGRVVEVTDPPWKHYGHSECFEHDNFERTMRQIFSQNNC